MIPLGDLREDGPFDKPSFSRNILMSFLAWKSLLFAHFLTVSNKKEGREAAANRAGSSRDLRTILRGDRMCWPAKATSWLMLLFLKKRRSVSCSLVSNSLKPHGLYIACQAPLSMEFSRHNTGVSSYSIFQGRRESS